MTEHEVEVEPDAAGERLDAFLARTLGGRSRSEVAGLIDEGAVLVDGRRRPKSHTLRGGERLAVREASRERARSAEPVPEPRVVWENDDLLVVDKPPGLVVHPAPGHRGVTLVEILSERSRGAWDPLAVHRLDRDTSGLMAVAKREDIQHELQRLIRSRELAREYLALAEGRLESRSGTIEAPLGRDARARTRMAVGGARPHEARTHFEVERFLEAHTLIRVRLETGRTHQIRAHFAAIGHPLAGDRAYGAPASPAPRQFLHSARIAFRYSGAGEPIDLESPLPPDLRAALAAIETGAGPRP